MQMDILKDYGFDLELKKNEAFLLGTENNIVLLKQLLSSFLLFITLPIMYGLYRVIYNAIEDVEKALEPFFTTLPDEERSGMGFTIMQTFMDDFKIESKKDLGTKILMSKKIGAKVG